jgi:hypothetical protein
MTQAAKTKFEGGPNIAMKALFRRHERVVA